MPDPALAARLNAHIANERCKQLLIDIVRVPSPQTDLFEAEPQLKIFIATAVEPRLRAMGFHIRHDAMGNLIAETGACRSGRSMMLVTHAMNQPPSTMPDPYGGKLIDASAHGLPGDAKRFSKPRTR